MKQLLIAVSLVAGLAVFPAGAEPPFVVDIPFAFSSGDGANGRRHDPGIRL